MSWRDTLRMPVSEAARVGAKQVARLLKTDVRELLRPKSEGPALERESSPPRSATTVTIPQAEGALATGAALAIDPQPRTRVSAEAEAKAWWNPGEMAFELYEIQRILAANAHARLYLARHCQWGIPVVLKAPAEELARDRARLQENAQAVARWSQCGLHPHIAYNFATHYAGEIPVFVIEYVDGGSLRQWLATRSLPSLRAQLDVAIQLCHALEYAHSRALTHGGLKPENVLLTTAGVVRVTDFGIARRRDDAAEPYTAPEQWVDGGPSDIASDMFALGVCLYELFCHGRPYEVTRGPRRKCAEPVAADGQPLPSDLVDVLQACVDWEPLRRPRQVSDVRLELARLREQLFRSPSPFATLPPNTWDADGWNNQGVVALALGRIEDAENAFESALAIEPRHLEANFNLGVLRWRAGRGSDEALHAALRNARVPRTAPWLATYLRALVALESGDGATTLELLRDLGDQSEHIPELDDLVRAARRCRPAHSLARELLGHAQPVAAVAMSSDGKWVLSGGDDHSLLLWDAFAGTAVRSLEGHEGHVTAVAMTADGHFALSGSEDGTVRLWDLRRARALKTLPVRGKVFALTLSSDARYAVISSAGSDNFLGIDGTLVELWDLEKERPLRRLEGHSSAVKALAMTPDARRLVSGADDQKAVLWDLQRGEPLRKFVGHEHFVSSVAISADGQHILSGSWDRSLRLWDARTGKCKAILRGHDGIVTSACLSDDASLAVSASWDNTVRVWDLVRLRCIRTLQGHRGMVTSVALASSVHCLASASWDSTVRLWDLPQPGPEVCAPRLSWRGDYAVLPPAEPTPEERIEQAFEALRAGDTHTSLYEYNRLVADGYGNTPALQDLYRALRPHSCIATVQCDPAAAVSLALDSPALACTFDEHQQRWLLAGHNGRLCMVPLTLDGELVVEQLSAMPLRAVVCLPDGTVAVAGLERRIYCLAPLPAIDAVTLAGHTSIVTHLVALPDGKFASASYDHTVRLWDLGKKCCSAVFARHQRQVSALACDASGTLLASGDLGGEVVVWNVGSLCELWRCAGHAGGATSLAFLRGTDVLVSGGADGRLCWWDVATGKCVASVEAHRGAVTHVVPLWDDAWVLTAGTDGSIRVWNRVDPAQSRVLYEGTQPITAVALAEGASRLLVCDAAGAVKALPLHWQLAEHRG